MWGIVMCFVLGGRAKNASCVSTGSSIKALIYVEVKVEAELPTRLEKWCWMGVGQINIYGLAESCEGAS